jgi:ribosomal protein S19E (S16A)
MYSACKLCKTKKIKYNEWHKRIKKGYDKALHIAVAGWFYFSMEVNFLNHSRHKSRPGMAHI